MSDGRDGAVLIRLARRRDLPAIARFAEAVVRDTYEPLIGVDGAARTLEWWGPTLADAVDDGLVHLATTADEIVGLVERGTFDGEPVVWKLYMAAHHRGGRIGPRLLDVTSADIEPGHDRLLLEHLAANERAARFYEREGFEVIRREPSDDPEHDLVWRARPLERGGDDYASSAEFHEIHMDAVWAEFGDVLDDAFGSVPADGVIVDVGAGSGAGVVAIAARTTCEIIAIEPDPTMRAMLLVRLAAAGLTDRVTVLSSPVPDVLDLVPGPVDGVVGAHMLGHLTSDHRAALLGWVAANVTDGGAALLTVSGTAEIDPDDVHVEERQVGRHVYRALHHSPDASTYESCFEVLADDQVLRSRVVTGRWERVTATDVRNTVAAAGLGVLEPRLGVAVVRR